MDAREGARKPESSGTVAARRGREHGRRSARAPRPWEGEEQARGTSRSKTLASSTGGSKTLAAVGMGCAGAERGHGRQERFRGAVRGRGRWERSERRRRRGAGEKVGSLTASGGRRQRPTHFHPCALVFILRTISRGGS